MDKNVTMKDIAAALDVSVVSVSKALSGKDGVSEQVRRKIIETSKKLGYIYDPVKKKEQIEHFNIGIIVADRFFNDNSFYYSLYRSILVKCAEIGFSGILEIVMPNDEKKCTTPNLIASNKVDGIIFMGEISPQYILNITKHELSCVMLDFYDDVNNGDSIISDSIYGSYVLTKLLIDTGHKNIRFVGTVPSTSSILDRYLGFCKAMLKNGIRFNAEEIIPDRDSDGRFIDLEIPDPLPDAFVCNCDEIAYLLTEKLKLMGYRIPEDVSVVGFDNYRFATICSPALTTFSVDMNAMTNAAINLLVRKMKGKPYTNGKTIVKGSPVFRNSVSINRLSK